MKKGKIKHKDSVGSKRIVLAILILIALVFMMIGPKAKAADIILPFS